MYQCLYTIAEKKGDSDVIIKIFWLSVIRTMKPLGNLRKSDGECVNVEL